MTRNTIAINGVVYDQHTCKPLSFERSALTNPSARSVHASVQRSTTLNRKYVSHPTRTTQPTQPIAEQAAPEAVPVRAVSEHKITKFAPHPIKAPASPKRVVSDIAPARLHPVAQRAVERHAVVAPRKPQPAQPAAVKPSQVLKNEAIANAMARTTPASQKREVKAVTKVSLFKRFAGIASASFALLLLGGYLTYLSMPNISTRVAAAQAGVNASYPSYKPSGYSLSGPVTFQQGSVSMKFAANGSPVSYTLTQASSGWDSTAVLDNYVIPKAGNNFSTTTAGGLTVYTFENGAAWINGGILYTIDGNANLSNDQLRRIATSV